MSLDPLDDMIGHSFESPLFAVSSFCHEASAMESINRAAVFVIPMKPYCEWASSIPDHTPITTDELEGTVFLLPEYEDVDDGDPAWLLLGDLRV
jgi:hypothetical protein